MSELTKALIAFHQQVDKIDKNARGNYGRFADLANVLSTITPALNANGLVITQTFLDDSLVTTLRHVSGESESSTTKLYIADGRNVTQEWGKAVTYQRRYAICSIVGLVADMDTDGEPTPEPEKKPAAKKSVQKKAAPKPEPTPVDIMDSPIPNDARQVVLDLLKQTFAKDADKVKSFPDTANLPLSQAFTTERHCAFINDFLAS
jgi:hypothetical protein